MSARKDSFYCGECGYETYKWVGRCPSCGSWNTVEEMPAGGSGRVKWEGGSGAVRLSEIEIKDRGRVSTGIKEFDRVLGGGAVTGSVLLLGGDPGIGKSTLLLQAAGCMAGERAVLYLSGEESLVQIKMRAQRLQVKEDLLVAAESELKGVLDAVERTSPSVLIIDSVQAVFDEEVDGIPGSIVQVKEIATRLIHLAKRKDIIIFLVGHVTKEGAIAGPRLLEHMVDGVFYLEGERYYTFRILRGVKNRFGSTNELGVFLMHERGLEEVIDPSLMFMSSNRQQSAGSAITVSMESSRPFLVEIQSLVTASSYASPRRSSTGLDLNRVNLIMAVLEKHLSMSFFGVDTFVNVVGGVRLLEPAVDLAVAAGLISSIKDKEIGQEQVILGEIGLTGEVRPVSRIVPRLLEAQKLGFKTAVISSHNLDEARKEKTCSLRLQGVDTVRGLFENVCPH